MPPRKFPPPARRPPATGTVTALRRGLDILHCFEEGTGALGNTEIAQRTGIPKPTVTRLVATLASLGYLRQVSESERHVLGPAVVSLANAFLSTLDVRACARPVMQKLAAETEGNVYLAVADRTDMVVIESARPPASGLIQRLSVGSRVPMGMSALGRAYFGALEPQRRAQLLPALRSASTGRWSTLETALRKAAGDVEARGYCESSDLFADIRTVAMPLASPTGEGFALSCGGPSFVFTEERLHERVAPRLLEAGRAIGRAIGGQWPGTTRLPDGAAGASRTAHR